MYNLEIHKKAKETLDLLKKKNLNDLKVIIDTLDKIVIKYLIFLI